MRKASAPGANQLAAGRTVGESAAILMIDLFICHERASSFLMRRPYVTFPPWFGVLIIYHWPVCFSYPPPAKRGPLLDASDP